MTDATPYDDLYEHLARDHELPHREKDRVLRDLQVRHYLDHRRNPRTLGHEHEGTLLPDACPTCGQRNPT